MAASAATPATPMPTNRPLSIALLADYSLLLGIVSGIPQLYSVLFAIDPHLFPVSANANSLGALRYNYILGGHQRGSLPVDGGILTVAIEDIFLLSPLYLATGIGLLRLRSWVYTIGLITGAMGLYSLLSFFLSDILGKTSFDQTDFIATLLSAVPYVAFDVWLLATLPLHRARFAPRGEGA